VTSHAGGVTDKTSNGRPGWFRTLVVLAAGLVISGIVAAWLIYPRLRVESAIHSFGLQASSIEVSGWSPWYPVTGSLGDVTVTLRDATYGGIVLDEVILTAPDLRDVPVIDVSATLHGVQVPVDDGSVTIATVEVTGDTSALVARAVIPVADAMRLRLGAGAKVLASFPYRIVGTSGWPLDPAMDVEIDIRPNSTGP